MNKTQLADLIAAKQNLSKKQAEDIVNLTFDTIISILKSGGEVSITGFGSFEARIRKGRTGVNPRQPSQKIQIPSVRVPKFKAGKTLKDALRENERRSEPPSTPAPQIPSYQAPNTPAPHSPSY
ncbi:MAG: HU family DNA-binding protein [Candidatus Uhrbacteria bacterium]